MQAGDLVASDVAEFTSRILVNGVERETTTWNVDRDLTGDLPDQVVAVHGVMQATGTIDWTAPEDVSDGARNPWNPSAGWVPARGDRVEIYVSDGVTEWRQFTGVIDQTTGSTNGGFRSTIVDRVDDLSVEVNHEPLLAIMPPIAFDGSEDWRRIGLHPLYFIDYALRQAGFYATPPQENIANLYAPLQGSLWPHRGTLRHHPGHQSTNTLTPWGLGRTNFEATYDPVSNFPMSDPTQITMMIAPDHAAPADFYLDYGARAHHLRLHVNASRQARAYKNDVEICRLNLGDAMVVNMLAKDGVISLRTNLGDEAAGSFSASGSGMSSIVVNSAEGSSVAGLQVSHPHHTSQEHQPTRWTPSARYDTDSLRLAGIINASPNIENRKAHNLLKEINDALLASMWIDEHGVMQWVMSDRLRMKPAVHTINTLDDVLQLDWETSLLQSASRVRITGKDPAITRGRWRTTILATGGRESLKSGDEVDVFLEAASGEDWIMPSYSFLEVGSTVGIWGSYNNPAYSVVGLYLTDDGGETERTGLGCDIETTRLGHQKALITYRAGNWPSDVEGVIETSPTSGGLWPKNQRSGIPRIVGMGKIEWIDSSINIEGPGGPGPELVHDTGYWANRTTSDSTKTNIAEYLASQVTVPQPVIRGLDIAPDPRLQLSDVINIESKDYMGVTLRALVVGKSTGFDNTGLHQSLTVRIIGSETTFTTFEQFQEELPGANLTYAQWQTLGPTPQTFNQFNRE